MCMQINDSRIASAAAMLVANSARNLAGGPIRCREKPRVSGQLPPGNLAACQHRQAAHPPGRMEARLLGGTGSGSHQAAGLAASWAASWAWAASWLPPGCLPAGRHAFPLLVSARPIRSQAQGSTLPTSVHGVRACQVSSRCSSLCHRACATIQAQ